MLVTNNTPFKIKLNGKRVSELNDKVGVLAHKALKRKRFKRETPNTLTISTEVNTRRLNIFFAKTREHFENISGTALFEATEHPYQRLEDGDERIETRIKVKAKEKIVCLVLVHRIINAVNWLNANPNQGLTRRRMKRSTFDEITKVKQNVSVGSNNNDR